ncbi:FGGY-family carbohydrate kinase [Dorea longicatena]|uniref:FGGY-family carbohydrate kinase n=1 Tax=Dorea longicatena TaxID=88431 RepID=UPI002ED64A1C
MLGINQSLAMKYRRELDKIQYCLNKKYDTIHMIGGGIQSKLLCQMTANATGCRVAAGPVEATAFGNIAVQMIALGQIKDIKEAREIIERSEATCYYEPQNTEEWSQAYARYCQVTKRQEEELE